MTTEKIPPSPNTSEISVAEEGSSSFNLSDAVAARIRELRLAKGWSQERLANEAGLSKDAVSRIERGERSGRLVTLERLAIAFGLSLPKLLDFKETPPQTGARNDRALQRLLDQLDPRLIPVVLNLIRSLLRVGSKPAN